MTEMSSEERIENALNGDEVDHIPFSPFLAYVWENFPEKIRKKGQLNFLKEVGADPLWRGAPCPVKVNIPDSVITKKEEKEDKVLHQIMTPVGNLFFHHVKSDTGNTDFQVGYPLRNEEDYKIQMWIEENKTYEINLDEAGKHLNNNGRKGLSMGMIFPRGKTAFQSLIELLAGTEGLIYALYDYPETVESLLEIMIENNLKASKMAAEADVYDYFLTWEDSSTTNYSPDLYKKYISREIKEICKILNKYDKQYIQHACGHVKDLLPIMKDDGVFAVESISHEPTGNITIKEAREVAGPQFGIIGGIEPTKFLNLDLDELKIYVKQVIKDASGGPLVLANSDSCPPGVSMEKFKLAADIAKNYDLS